MCVLLNGLNPGVSVVYHSVIVRVRVVSRKTVAGDLRFDYLGGTVVLQIQMKNLHQMMVFMPLVI